MQEKIFQLLFEQDDITWQTIIYDLVRTEQMDPWDINITELTHKYIGIVKGLQQMDFRVSGKVLLAAAILLRIKSTRLVGDDMLELDRLLYPTDDIDQDQFYDELENNMLRKEDLMAPGLIPRTPQPRKRKVSVYDLIGALEQALEVKRRRIMRDIPALQMEAPEKKMDISVVIRKVYNQIMVMFSTGHKVVTFSELVPSEAKKDKVHTFIPLLHLSNQRKIDLWQKEHFGDIEIILARKEVDRELS
ncbi:MAG: ScpA family protein [Candidatus Woesearchaeota archaeon]